MLQDKNNPQKMNNLVENQDLQDFTFKRKNKAWKLIDGVKPEDVASQLTKWPFIYEIYKKNELKDQWKLIQSLMRIPTPSDGHGFIYGFMDESQNKIQDVPFWIKMGRTKQKMPQQRIFQWEKQDKKQFSEIFTVRSAYNIKLQYVVHALFAYARKPRMVGGEMRKQWFYFEQKTITCVAVAVLNQIMESIHKKFMHEKTQKQQIVKPYNSLLAQINHNLEQINKQFKNLINNIGQNCLKLCQQVSTDLKIEIGDRKCEQLFKQQKSVKQILCKIQDRSTIINQLQLLTQRQNKTKQNYKQFSQNIQQFTSNLQNILKGSNEKYQIKQKQNIQTIKQQIITSRNTTIYKEQKSKKIDKIYNESKSVSKNITPKVIRNQKYHHSVQKKQFMIRQVNKNLHQMQHRDKRQDILKPIIALGIPQMIGHKAPITKISLKI